MILFLILHSQCTDSDMKAKAAVQEEKWKNEEMKRWNILSFEDKFQHLTLLLSGQWKEESLSILSSPSHYARMTRRNIVIATWLTFEVNAASYESRQPSVSFFLIIDW